MEVKKYSKPEVKNKRMDFFLVGLSLSLFVVLAAFSWTVYDAVPEGLSNIIIEEDLPSRVEDPEHHAATPASRVMWRKPRLWHLLTLRLS